MTFIYNSPVNFNIPKISFRSNPATYSPAFTPAKDNFSTNPLYDNFGTKEQIEAEAKANPGITELLNKYNLPLKVNIEELEKLKKGHLKDTRIAAAQICSSLPENLKQKVNLSELQEAAMFHDYGKVLLPKAILNKNGPLSDEEREIMHLHSELSYELLKNKDFSENTLKLIKYHHQTPLGNGYPKADNDFEYGLDLQILNTADKYTALREERSYKPALSAEEALETIQQDVDKGLIQPEIYDALEKSVKK